MKQQRRACKPETQIKIAVMYALVKINIAINANKFVEMKQHENWLKQICKMNEAIEWEIRYFVFEYVSRILI